MKSTKGYNPEVASNRYKKIRDNNIQRILEYYDVDSLSCNRCGATSEYFGFFDFHHIDPNTKEASISSMMGHTNWKKMEKELAKCEVLCSNCHRTHHLKEQENERRKNVRRKIFEVEILQQGD